MRILVCLMLLLPAGCLHVIAASQTKHAAKELHKRILPLKHQPQELAIRELGYPHQERFVGDATIWTWRWGYGSYGITDKYGSSYVTNNQDRFDWVELYFVDGICTGGRVRAQR